MKELLEAITWRSNHRIDMWVTEVLPQTDANTLVGFPMVVNSVDGFQTDAHDVVGFMFPGSPLRFWR